MNNNKLTNILKPGKTRMDLCFREVPLHVKKEGLNWREAEGKRPIRRFWKIMNNGVKTA